MRTLKRALLAAVFPLLIGAALAAPKVIQNFPLEVFPAVPDTNDADTDSGEPQDAVGQTPRFSGAPSVWEMPQLQDRLVKLRLAAAILFRQGKFEDAEKVCRQTVQLIPHDAAGYYLLASTQGRQGKNDDALASLSKAIDLGFNKSEILQRDASFKGLHDNLRFAELIAAARLAEPEPSPWRKNVRPIQVQDGAATVTTGNTTWDAQHGVFVALFQLPKKDEAANAVANDTGTGKQINEWYKEGTAAGNYGDFYDNHDGGHSSPRLGFFPQMTKIQYGEDAKRRKYHTGLQTRFFFNGVVIGNSSTALVNSPYWRSQPRLAYVNKRNAALLYLQYIKNHLYVYPEHNDHDEKHGDVFPANTPYVIITQGSSWSDKPVLEALGYTLAAFRPEVKEFLAKNGALMPTVQLIFRISQNSVKKPEDYLTGKAHPTVFGGGFSAGRMVQSAHNIHKDETPPLVKLRVLEDDDSAVGKDFFDIGNRQEQFTTPCAIARVHRTSKYRYRMVVSADDSLDLNGRDLTYHWKVLRGDADDITIKPLNESGSQVELLVPWRPKQPISPGSSMDSNRVDIGCFVHNGLYYSAPAFVTFFTLANEERGYFENGKVAYINYKDSSTGGDYVDPFVDTPKTWKDVYKYDDRDRLIGWIRERGDSKQHFTADGAIILSHDEHGRAQLARTVRYTASRKDAKQPPVLAQSLGDEILQYAYDSPDDQVGKVIKRERAP